MQLIPFNRKKEHKTDPELLEDFLKNRDIEILGELYSRYMYLIYGVCLKYFKEPEKSKDAVIELFEKVQTQIQKHEVKNFKSWVYVVTKNHCLMELRKTKTGEMILVSSNEELANFMENETELHPIDKGPDKKLETALNRCIEKLKAEQKKCIRLFYYENKCYREIAGLLKLDEKKVKSFIQNGKRNLKICLEKQK
ncbi:MAG: sigma-70 family RNA polymerase sigma factor [Prolixibacteraceae bacterium]|jgi:RNA polymerase sigma factor (sigma-70 family)|nr:sigma-70 family RNA polymerase sigma factor [Prolixibacteraceae bacterium]MBT6007068.1 sigma-70 family RNA polymerase sigma factor [Prolixibacteraceae bacterium]MBT6765328.1 sigma-70 family RNA polymerase sigma factor [Prolixibacteraceae bacterium]MBT6997057.1 sigma-70 family RNA polymerase sigma factor [Prolixibacteraceae bacterium]MBT7396058.1 sigma-70 family RNA polymerase sigma factor [Prolixibacteraceae bacterium]